MLTKHHFAGVLLLLAGSLIMAVGCGEAAPPGSEFYDQNIKRLRSAYDIHLRLNNFKAPKSEEEFKEFCTTDLTAKYRLNNIGVNVDDFDSIFVSERDGQPFTVRYGVNGLSDKPIVFETEGVDGKRLVAFWDPIEVDEARYKDLLAGKEDKKKDAEEKAALNQQ